LAQNQHGVGPYQRHAKKKRLNVVGAAKAAFLDKRSLDQILKRLSIHAQVERIEIQNKRA